MAGQAGDGSDHHLYAGDLAVRLFHGFILVRTETGPQSLYEAARIDGASRVRIFFKITLPMITSIAFFNIIMHLITALQNFTSAFVVTNGGPNKATYVLG